MPIPLVVRQATPSDTEAISSILFEAAQWLTARGMPMWRTNELSPETIAADVNAGLFFLAQSDGDAVATIKFQLTDHLFWPDVDQADSAFIHRFAVRRAYAGGSASGALIGWARQRAEFLGRRYLRLDCEASRTRLRAVYERFGFRHHSDRQVGPYLVARYELSLKE